VCKYFSLSCWVNLFLSVKKLKKEREREDLPLFLYVSPSS
jgi:hypothetical protein